jgi:hypothetical protein
MELIVRGWVKKLGKFEDRIILALIYLVGLTLIIDSALALKYDILDYNQYQFMFQWLPPKTIFLRYCGSIIFRCVFIATVTGVCLRREIFRKLLIGLTLLGVAILLWKHPYHAIVNANIYAHTNLTYFHQTIRLSWAPQQEYYLGFLAKMADIYIQDIIKATLVLFFFSYPSVRKCFI